MSATTASRQDAVKLTARHVDVLRLLAAGGTRAEIAGQLWISQATVGKNIGELYSRLGVRNVAEAIEAGHRIGLLETPDGNARAELSALVDLVLDGDYEGARSLGIDIKARLIADQGQSAG